MTDLAERLEQLATRGEPRGADAVAHAAYEEARDMQRDAAQPTPPRAGGFWRRRIVTMLTVGAAAAIVASLLFVDRAPSPAPSGPTASTTAELPGPSVVIPATAGGWVFDEGDVRTFVDRNLVAQFPGIVSPTVRPVRVSGGFVAVIGNGGFGDLWYAPDNTTSALQLASNVNGVAAAPGGDTIVYSSDAGYGLGPTTLIVADVASGQTVYSTVIDGTARVMGYSYPNVELDTGDGANAAAGYWVPDTGATGHFAGYGSVGGVGPSVAILRQGDGLCSDLVHVDHGTATPTGRAELDPQCETGRWSFDASGVEIVGFGFSGNAQPLRILHDGVLTVSTTRVIDAVWIDSSTIAAIDEHGSVAVCDVSGLCNVVRVKHSTPIQPDSLWLIEPS